MHYFKYKPSPIYVLDYYGRMDNENYNTIQRYRAKNGFNYRVEFMHMNMFSSRYWCHRRMHTNEASQAFKFISEAEFLVDQL